jgi:hypothetical protein
MSSITLTPSSDLSVGSNWSKNGFSGSYSAALTDGSDSTYASVGSSTNGALELNLSAIPANVTAITGVQILLRIAVSSTKGNSQINFSVGNASGFTHLSSEVDCVPTTSFANITTSATLNDSAIADWNTAYLWIQSNNDGNGVTLKVAEASAILTVTLSSGIYSESCPTGGAVQTTGLIGLTPAFIVGHATIGSRNFW